jgi:2-oxoglutarate dehydrogenase complex dehydrogenase (E1) component-like enzyme
MIDLICYRRYGHNELDEPSFTQPQLYSFIKKKPKVSSIYENQLIQQNVVPPGFVNKIVNQTKEFLEK